MKPATRLALRHIELAETDIFTAEFGVDRGLLIDRTVFNQTVLYELKQLHHKGG
jgi:hypothetical protein